MSALALAKIHYFFPPVISQVLLLASYGESAGNRDYFISNESPLNCARNTIAKNILKNT